MMDRKILIQLKKYMRAERNIVISFLFGSAATGRATDNSDVDIAVYLKNTDAEDTIRSEISHILGKEVDLVLINNAPATLVSSAFKTGIPLAIKNRRLYWDFYLEKTLEAEDFVNFAEDFYRISARSRSLSPEDKVRVLERITFLNNELLELDKFKEVSFKEYHENKAKRREVERWTENIINAMIDVSKIILAAEKQNIPRTYEDALLYFGLLSGLSEQEAQSFGRFAKLRNILAHEYLDILHGRIKHFIDEFPIFYKKIHTFMSDYLNRT